MCACVCVAPISSLHSASAGAVRSASGLAGQIKDVPAAASRPAAERLRVDFTFLSLGRLLTLRPLCLDGTLGVPGWVFKVFAEQSGSVMGWLIFF